jgi:cytochrome P450
VVATLAPRITQITHELLNAAAGGAPGPFPRGSADGGELELVSQLAYPLPVQIISELLGVPPEDHSRFAGWSAKLAHSVQPSFGALDPAERAAAEQASVEFGEYFTELIAVRRSRPADDLLTKLIRAEDAGDRLTVAELIATCVLLLVAGHETTVGLISNAMLALLRNPEQYAALAADPELAASAVEETLRYDSPVQLTGRVARRGIAIDGFEPADGAVMLLLIAATGHDPAMFADPNKFDIRRGAREHLAFAAGPHFCLGAPLARLEATIALRALATRLVGPVLDEAALTYKQNFNLRGPERMVITFDEIRPVADG